MGPIILFAGMIALIIDAVAAFKFEAIALEKGHPGYFGWCFFLGVVGWLMVIALPDRGPISEETAAPKADDSLPEL